tara:strand:+ start:129 stop:389 length:261 start_codon:yes stop_codon:yes gene_type:complete
MVLQDSVLSMTHLLLLTMVTFKLATEVAVEEVVQPLTHPTKMIMTPLLEEAVEEVVLDSRLDRVVQAVEVHSQDRTAITHRRRLLD